MGNNNDYQIIRNEHNGVLQGFSIWAKTDPITVLIHTDESYLHYHTYRGWASFGVNNSDIQATAFATQAEAHTYIEDNNLTKKVIDEQ